MYDKSVCGNDYRCHHKDHVLGDCRLKGCQSEQDIVWVSHEQLHSKQKMFLYNLKLHHTSKKYWSYNW